MKTEVIRDQVSVRLELTLDEYRVLNGLRYQHLGGTHELRRSLEDGFRAVDRELGFEPDYRRTERNASFGRAEHYLNLTDTSIKARDV